MKSQTLLQPSLLDRLIDPALSVNLSQPGYTIAQMYQAVLRDLQDLLNTQLVYRDIPAELRQVRDSIICYGLPDLAALEGNTRFQRAEIGHSIRQVIQRFEPRLRAVEVILPADDLNTVLPSVRFLVSGQLNLEPAPEVAFDTILEIASGHFQVKEAAA